MSLARFELEGKGAALGPNPEPLFSAMVVERSLGIGLLDKTPSNKPEAGLVRTQGGRHHPTLQGGADRHSSRSGLKNSDLGVFSKEDEVVFKAGGTGIHRAGKKNAQEGGDKKNAHP